MIKVRILMIVPCNCNWIVTLEPAVVQPTPHRYRPASIKELCAASGYIFTILYSKTFKGNMHHKPDLSSKDGFHVADITTSFQF